MVMKSSMRRERKEVSTHDYGSEIHNSMNWMFWAQRKILIVHEAESLPLITRGLFCRCWSTDRQTCTVPMEALLHICQEGRNTKILIGIIHSSTKTISSCVFTRDCDHLWLLLCTAVFSFCQPVKFRRLSWDKKLLPLCHVALPRCLLCSLAACHPTNHSHRKSVMPYSIWCRRGGETIYYFDSSLARIWIAVRAT